ncbi:MAG: hypothetical protein HYY17_14380 [Planctomycetes bacterium]|nr:hypothetical protein [Planctomycetota bacterium]
MGRGQVLDAALHNRHRYLWEDPVRFGCVVCALLLTFAPIVPFLLTLFVVLVVQMGAVALVSRFSLPGWSHQWGKRLHPGILASSMCVDWTNLTACTIVGAMLFVRHFGLTQSLQPLCVLAAGVCLLPDARLCRWLLATEPGRRAEHLREGYFWRDPVKLGAMLSWAVVCWLDRGTLYFLALSVVFLQLNSLIVMADKYLSEIEVTRPRGLESLLLEREGRRFMICLSPLALLPARHSLGDEAAVVLAITAAALIVVPDVIRFLMSLAARFWGWVFRPRRMVMVRPATTLVGVLRG